jgi:hypothetical protein
MADFSEKKTTSQRTGAGAGAAGETTSDTIKAAASDAAEAVQGAAAKAKDVVQDAATRGAQSAGEAATEGYRVSSDVAQRGDDRGREIVSQAPSPSDAIGTYPLVSIGLAALVGGIAGWMLRGSQGR